VIVAVTRPRPDWNALQRVIAGDVVLPGSPGYESARKPQLAQFDDVRPQAIVACASPADVAETISLAKRCGLHAAPRSGGHCFAGRSSTRGIVIDVTPMSSVSVSGGVAAVGAGARLSDLYDSLDDHGVTIPAGCGPTVGIAGLTLGGGLGIMGRKYGLTSDHLVGAEVVLADGRIVECDDHHEEELFWALRGAGGGFGVVTSLAFRTVAPPTTTSFDLVWPIAQARALVDAWQAWAPAAPEELAASLLITAGGDVERPPVANLFGAMLAPEPDAAELLEALVAQVGADPVSVSRRQMPYREAKRHLAEVGEQLEETSTERTSPAGHPHSKSEFFRRPLPPEAIAALVENISNERVPGQSYQLDFTPWGGAYNRVAAGATAFAHRDELFLLKHAVVVAPDASSSERDTARRWLNRSWASVRPWGTGGVYPNFPDPDLPESAPAYYGAGYDRLLHVKARYDPGNFFRFQH
jgi:FAD/FMN-containing dehydrogenase